MKKTYSKRFITVFSCLTLLPLLSNIAGARPVFLSGDFRYRVEESGDQKLETFTQNYTVDLNKQLQLSEVMELSAGVRYNRLDEDDDEITDIVNPTVRFAIDNNLFKLNLDGFLNERFHKNEPDLSSRSWQMNWESKWQRTIKRPGLRFYAGQTWQQDDQTPYQQNSLDNDAGASVDWDFKLFRTYYSFRHEYTENKVALSDNQRDRHFGKLETGKIFLNNRLKVQFAQQVSFEDRESTSPVTAGFASIPVSIAQAYDSLDDTPANGALNNNNALSDNNRNVQALQLNNPAALLNLGIRVNFNEVNIIHLYTVEDFSALTNQFRWDVYTSNDNLTWTNTAQNVTFSFDSIRSRFEINTGDTQAVYVKVVATSFPINTVVTFTEIEAFDRRSASGSFLNVESDHDSYNSDLDISFKLRQNLLLSSNLSYDNDDFSDLPDFERESYNGTLRWTPNEKLSSTLYASATFDDRDGQEETSNRSYGVQFYTLPIPTVDLITSLTLNERFEGSDKKSESYFYTISADAQLFRGLSSSLDLSLLDSDDFVLNTQSKTFDAQFTTTARLTPKLITDLEIDYERQIDPSKRSETEGVLSLSWRPSDIFSLTTAIEQDWAVVDETNYFLSLNIAPTEKIQATSTYQYASRGESNHLMSMNLRWTISKYFSLLTIADYTFNDETDDEWTIQTQFSARYGI